MMTCVAQNSYASFEVKHTAVIHPAAVTKQYATHHKTSIVYRLTEKIHALLLPHDPDDPYYIPNKKGIFGTLALIFGIASFIPIYGLLFGAAAIVLGLIGMHKHQKLAKAGLVLGCIGFIANLVYLALLVILAFGSYTLAVF